MIEASFEAVVPKAINAEFEAIIPREKAFDIVNKDIHIDTNGKYEVKADAGTAMTQVNVEVDVNPYNAVVEYADDTIFGKDSYKNVTIKEGVKSIGDYSFYYAKNIENVILPSTMESIGIRCFSNSNIININLHDGIKNVGSYAFSRCSNLKQYIHPRGIDTVPERVCDYCSSLEYVYFPNTIRVVKPYAFYSTTAPNSILVVESVNSWINIVFEGELSQKPLPNLYVKNAYFGNVDSVVNEIVIDSITLPLFKRFKNIRNVKFSKESTSLPTSCFEESSVVSVNLGGCTTINRLSFYNCVGLENIDISNIENLGDRCFYGCVNLSSPMKFNPAITTIDVYTFFHCVKIPYFDFRNHEVIPTLANTNAFTGISTTCKIAVPDALYDQWIVATNWATYKSRIVKASEFVEPTNN